MQAALCISLTKGFVWTKALLKFNSTLPQCNGIFGESILKMGEVTSSLQSWRQSMPPPKSDQPGIAKLLHRNSLLWVPTTFSPRIRSQKSLIWKLSFMHIYRLQGVSQYVCISQTKYLLKTETTPIPLYSKIWDLNDTIFWQIYIDFKTLKL